VLLPPFGENPFEDSANFRFIEELARLLKKESNDQDRFSHIGVVAACEHCDGWETDTPGENRKPLEEINLMLDYCIPGQGRNLEGGWFRLSTDDAGAGVKL